MSAAVKLSSKLPGNGDINGLDATATDLVDDPARVRYGVILYDCSAILDDTDTGDRIPTVRVRRIEPLGDADSVSKAVAAEVAAAEEKRTGRRAIPFEVVEVDEGYDPDQLEIGDDE